MVPKKGSATASKTTKRKVASEHIKREQKSAHLSPRAKRKKRKIVS
jgi:hypothetical protein